MRFFTNMISLVRQGQSVLLRYPVGRGVMNDSEKALTEADIPFRHYNASTMDWADWRQLTTAINLPKVLLLSDAQFCASKLFELELLLTRHTIVALMHADVDLASPAPGLPGPGVVLPFFAHHLTFDETPEEFTQRYIDALRA